MKFCYLDESGTGGQSVGVMVGVVVDAARMHLTKNHWGDLLKDLTKIVGKEVHEFHAHRFYKGSGIWSEISGDARSDLIEAIIQWVKTRKHKIVFSAVDTAKFEAESADIPQLKGLSLWRVLGLHVSLAIQRAHQKEAKNKGNTVLIFDDAVKEKSKFTQLLLSPPNWTDGYYQRAKLQEALDQLIDVPHFVDSKVVPLVQVADLYAYILRRHFELSSALEKGKYKGEEDKVAGWAEEIMGQSIGNAHIFPSKGASDAALVFQQVAPSSCL